jgi:hypothetical protein
MDFRLAWQPRDSRELDKSSPAKGTSRVIGGERGLAGDAVALAVLENVEGDDFGVSVEHPSP